MKVFLSCTKPARKTAPYHPPLRQYHKTVQSVSFDNPYPRTHQLLYRQRKCSACVATVGKEFLYRAKMIPLTFQCHQAAFSHGCRDYEHVLRKPATAAFLCTQKSCPQAALAMEYQSGIKLRRRRGEDSMCKYGEARQHTRIISWD